ncbi:hypothetical protein [Streptomyces sp. ODS28]|uniref:hypothetical protein n=1 Tax=Streptomyces sp. ODS28 TaxID=3136688 RepID=UPI0031EEC202
MTSETDTGSDRIEAAVRRRLAEEIRVPEELLDGRTPLADLAGSSPSKVHRAARRLEEDFGLSIAGADAQWLTSVRAGVERITKALERQGRAAS